MSFFSGLESLKSLDFHHEIEAFLFFDPLLFESFVLFKLLVSNCNDFRVEYHLVHVLDIIVLLIKLLLGLGE